MKNQVNNFLKEESGEANIIAIILVIIVVIALVAIFRTQLTEIVNGLFQQIKDSLGI
jgi:Flp pilus assembly pilin Flp